MLIWEPIPGGNVRQDFRARLSDNTWVEISVMRRFRRPGQWKWMVRLHGKVVQKFLVSKEAAKSAAEALAAAVDVDPDWIR